MPNDLPDWTSEAIGTPIIVTGTTTNGGDNVLFDLAGRSSVILSFSGAMAADELFYVQIINDDGGLESIPVWQMWAGNGGAPPSLQSIINFNATDSSGRVGSVWRADVSGAKSMNIVKLATGTGNTQTWTLRATTSTFQPVPPTPNIHKTLAATVNAGATGTIWTPASGLRFNLLLLVVAVSVSGEYDLTDGGGLFIPLGVQASVNSLVLPIPGNGRPSAARNNALGIKNNTGANATVNAYVAGYECP